MLIILVFPVFCGNQSQTNPIVVFDPELRYKEYHPESTELVISREEYLDKLQGFWLGACIANWTGLVTEMDKIGNIGEIRTGDFYTREDWGKPDQPNIWSTASSELSPTIDFFSEMKKRYGVRMMIRILNICTSIFCIPIIPASSQHNKSGRVG